jgi:hypothetical protein
MLVRIAVVLGVVAGCKSDAAAPQAPTQPASPEATVTSPEPEPALLPPKSAKPDPIATPVATAGLIAYVKRKRADSTVHGHGALHLVAAEGGQPAVALGIDDAKDLVTGPHLVTGRRLGSNKQFVVDVRQPAIVAKPIDYVDFVTPDDRLVSRCSGGAGAEFAICISDGDGANKRELLREPATEQSVGIVAGVSSTHVFAHYSAKERYTTPFALAFADSVRTPVAFAPPPNEYGVDPRYARNGSVVGACQISDKGIAFMFASTKPKAKLQKVALGVGPQCRCELADDGTRAACAVGLTKDGKPATREATGLRYALVVIDLKKATATTIFKEAVFDLAFSPDGKELAITVPAGDHDEVLRVISIDGKRSRDLATIDSPALIGWLHPI